MGDARVLAHVKELRSAMTEAEARLWYHLRAHRFLGLKFKRQKPIGRYIVDFACVERGLIVELDGSQHVDRQTYDAKRTASLEAAGFKVMRFWNDEVLRDTEAVLEALHLALSPGPSPASGRGE